MHTRIGNTKCRIGVKTYPTPSSHAKTASRAPTDPAIPQSLPLLSLTLLPTLSSLPKEKTAGVAVHAPSPCTFSTSHSPLALPSSITDGAPPLSSLLCSPSEPACVPSPSHSALSLPPPSLSWSCCVSCALAFWASGGRGVYPSDEPPLQTSLSTIKTAVRLSSGGHQAIRQNNYDSDTNSPSNQT